MATTQHRNNRRKKSQSRLSNLASKTRDRALKAGTTKLLVLAGLVALALGALLHYQYLSPQSDANEQLRRTLGEKRKQNAIARMVQETKPQFLDQFRRLINNYTTARELLPSEAEVSNVLDAIQQMARENQVRVTMFDASKPGGKSTNPTAQAATPPAPNSSEAQPAQPQIGLNERVMPAQIQGIHANVARFLSAVARYPRIIYVRGFSITSLNRQESVNLTLVTYDAPTSDILPPIPEELRQEFQNQTAQLAPVPKPQITH